jgi:L-ascorbate metabolism protein UlaG (beta-lactamase superfamily)
MKIRYLGHSCVEIVGRNHILIDPDFTRDPEPDVKFILITHAHKDHIAKVAEVPTGKIVASPDTCRIAANLGVSENRLCPVRPGIKIGNIMVLPGFSQVNNPVYTFFYLLFRRRMPDPGGTPLSFLVKDEATLLHIGDAHQVNLDISPDILCLPWRKTPFGPKRYKRTVVEMAKKLSPRHILPIHYDLPGTEADPRELEQWITGINVLESDDWFTFQRSKLVENYKKG